MCCGMSFVVAVEALALVDPPVGAFDESAAGLDLEAVGRFRPGTDIHADRCQVGGLGDRLAGVALVADVGQEFEAPSRRGGVGGPGVEQLGCQQARDSQGPAGGFPRFASAPAGAKPTTTTINPRTPWRPGHQRPPIGRL